MTYRKVTRTIEVQGIELPVFPEDRDLTPEIVFVPEHELVQVAEQDMWDTHFGHKPVLLDAKTGDALMRAGLAQRDAKGGYHGTRQLRNLLTNWGWI